MIRFQHAVAERKVSQALALEEAVQMWISWEYPPRSGKSSLGELTEEQSRLCGIVKRWFEDPNRPAFALRWLNDLEEIMGAAGRSKQPETKPHHPKPDSSGIQ